MPSPSQPAPVDPTALSCPVPISEHREITLAHGSGGKLTHRLIEQLILPNFRNELLEPLHDGAVFPIGGSRLAFSTDSYVISPLFFPGGDIGSLSVHGTVNDLAMCGARPLHLSAAFIIEEGLPLEDLERIVRSMKAAADASGVSLVTGDTKVVDRGKGDRLFINTSGIGLVREGIDIHPRRAAPGDRILVSGPIAEHGIAILSVREGLEFETRLASDSAPLNGLVDALLDAVPGVHVLRDPTRGGVTGILCEIAGQAHAGIHIEETRIPLREEVKGACEMLGLDPLHVANEGKLIAIVPPGDAAHALAALQSHPLGRGATDIGGVVADHPGLVVMKTRIGGTRVVDLPTGEQLPRIC